jgi:hypothetical protein
MTNNNVAQLIDLISQGKNAEASDLLNSELLSRSYAAIEDIKPEVAMNYFAPVISIDADGGITTSEFPDSVATGEPTDNDEETPEEDSEE